MFNIVLIVTDKPINSTNNENYITGVTVNGELKEGSNILTPIIKVLYDNTSIVTPRYNYCKIVAFQRKYWIDDWIYEEGYWYAKMHVDVLGTYRDDIHNSTQYVIRSASETDNTIIDTLYPITTYESVQKTEFDHFPITDFSDGCFIVSILNENGGLGGLDRYAFTSADIVNFFGGLLQNPSYLDGTATTADVFKYNFNPIQYITSVMYFPFPIGAVGNMRRPIKLGWWALPDTLAGTPIRGTTLNQAVISDTKVVTLPKHPNGGFFRASPFTEYILLYPPFGRFVLPATKLVYATSLQISVSVDLITGLGSLRVLDNVGDYCYLYETSQIGVPVQYTQITQNVLGIMASAGAAVGHAVTLKFGDMFKDIGDAIQSAMPETTVRGTTGSILALKETPALYTTIHDLPDESNTLFGRPLMKERKLDDLDGYCKCQNVKIEIKGTEKEAEEIISFLENGVFIYHPPTE